jgi:hypothetical protein
MTGNPCLLQFSRGFSILPKKNLFTPSLNSGTHWMPLNSRTIKLLLGYPSKTNFSMTLFSTIYNKSDTQKTYDKKTKKLKSPTTNIDGLMF